jgi:hypothetical protein
MVWRSLNGKDHAVKQLEFAVLAALVMLGTAGGNRASAQNLDPAGSWTVTPFTDCTATLTVEDASATWKSDCVHNGMQATVNEVATRRDLGNGEFEFTIVPDKSSVSNYNMDAKLVLKMASACSASLDVVEPKGNTGTFKASRTGPGC